MHRLVVVVAAALAALSATAFATGRVVAAQSDTIAGYYQALLAYNPTLAAELAIHARDAELESFSADSVAGEIRTLRAWDAIFAGAPIGKVSPAEADDTRLVRVGIAQRLVELEDVQAWRRLPDFYPDLASRSVYVIIKRAFAPPGERLRSWIAREQKIPALLAAGKKNLRSVSRVAVEIALDEVDGIRDFFAKDVPLAFTAVTDRKLRAELDRATSGVTAALVDYR